MNVQLNQWFAMLSTVTELSGIPAQTIDKLLKYLFPQESASAARIVCRTLSCGICIPIRRIRFCRRRCQLKGYPPYIRIIRVRC